MGVKLLTLASLTLIASLSLTGCSSEKTDPLEQINKEDDFRICVRDWLAREGYNFVEGDYFHFQAKKACAYLLE